MPNETRPDVESFRATPGACTQRALWVQRLRCGVAFADYLSRPETKPRKGDIPHLLAGLRTTSGTAETIGKRFPELAKKAKSIGAKATRIMKRAAKLKTPKKADFQAIHKDVMDLVHKSEGLWGGVEKRCRNGG